ncbi:MAG: alcohol dehydrogenase [Chloroflexota bacterium]
MPPPRRSTTALPSLTSKGFSAGWPPPTRSWPSWAPRRGLLDWRTVRAVRFHRFGEPEVLVYEDIPDPKLGPGEAVVRVRACGVNHLDLDIRSGISRLGISLPHILGREVAGEVAALGPDAGGFRVGDRVLVAIIGGCGRCPFCRTGRDNLCPEARRPGINRPGGYAELVVARVEDLIPVPRGLGFEEAAAVPIAFGTAYHMLITQGGLKVGETVLINAAGSTIGTAAIQVARAAGARVVVTAGSEAKLERARELGAHDGVNYSLPGWENRILELTDGRGPDVIFEHVGGEVFKRSLAILAVDGRLCVCGGHAGEIVDLDLISLFRKQARVIGSFSATRREVELALDLVARGELRPVIHGVYPLAEARLVHKLLASRANFGKLILNP